MGGYSIADALAHHHQAAPGPPRRRRRGLRLVAGTVVVAAAAGGGYVGYTRWVSDTPLEAVDTSTRQTVATDGGTFAGNGYTVNVPAGAIAGDAQVVEAVVAAEPLGNEIFGPAVGIEHDQPLNGPIEVRWDITTLTQPQRDALILVRYNDDLGVWAADPPTLDVPYRIEGDELIADIDTWSFWSWDTIADIGQEIGELTGSRTDPPECSGGLPDWVDSTVIPNADSDAAAILACYEADADKGVTVRVANNRTFSQQLHIVDAGYEYAWTWPGETELGMDTAVSTAAHAALDNPTTFLIPPLTEISVGLARPDSPGTHFVGMEADVNAVTFLVDIAGWALDQIDPGLGGNPVVDAFIEVLYSCGGEQLLGMTETDLNSIGLAVISALYDCASLIVERDGKFGEMYERIALEAVNTEGAAGQALFEQANRFAVKAATAFKLIEIGKIAFYLSDQFANALVGNLTTSVNMRGTPQELGAWTPTCNNVDTDSNRAYRNIALRDEFADTSYELWQFDGWAAAAQLTAQPLVACTPEYRADLADTLPGTWGDPKAAGILADAIRALDQPAPAATGTAQPAEQPNVAPQGGSPSQSSFDIGDEFHAECVVAWPTAPSYGIDSVMLTMTCDGVPLSQYLFTHVQYGNPDIPVTPTNSTMIVHGQIVDIIQSGWGYSTLEVVADNIDCCTASF